MHPVNELNRQISRRNLLHGGIAIGTMALFARGVFAEHLDATPVVEEGPFYPYDRLPLNPDNDLIVPSDTVDPSIGIVTHLGGKIMDEDGNPLKNCIVEIWQCDSTGTYLAQGDDHRDKNFKGYGRFTTGAGGEYRFRTIKPVPYSGRPAAHIHFKIKQGKDELLTTQLFIAGFAGNKRDSVYSNIRDPLDRELVSVDFTPVKDSKIGEMTALFDVVLGKTPADAEPTHQH